MKKKVLIIVICLLIVSLIAGIVFVISGDNTEIKTIRNEKELLAIYNGEDNTAKDILMHIITMPFSLLTSGYKSYYTSFSDYLDYDYVSPTRTIDSAMSSESSQTLDIENFATKGTQKDYSTTNIQVENVDEADITKTDGDYIYSISESNVIITDVRNPEEIKIAATITSNSNCVPEDLILYKDKLVVIFAKGTSGNYTKNGNTVVKVYNIASKEKPLLVKSYELNQPYYTSRCINNELYVISSGYLKKENNKIVRTYIEDGLEQEIALDNIKYLKDVNTRKQTIISALDLNNAKSDVKVSSYLIDISNAYVSENSIYLLEQKYDYSYNSSVPPISSLFGLAGAIGPFIYEDDYDYYSYGYYTKIFKFDILNDGNVEYNSNEKIKGKTINQYSLDEENGHLRIALYDNEGARVAILDENLKQIGISSYVAKGETMYSSRFMGNKVYLVTYKNMDPLFVIDLSDETKPRVLGELHIPGYSTYLHPYDETHLIGIGMQTEETVRRDSSGKVLSTSANIIGMKMALFDVSDVNNPIQISETVIGDRRTTSAILTNPKALLFSREKQLIAIPVNNYSEDVDMGTETDSYESSISRYKNYSKAYIAEGYFVYTINLTNGFKLRGTITHENTKTSGYYTYGTTSKLLRGLYIDDNLFTVSEAAIKVNKLDTLEQISEIKISK